MVHSDERVAIGLRLVHSRASRYSHGGVDRDDLVSAGMVAVAESLQRAENVEQFVAYAKRRIDGAMRDECRALPLMSHDERRLARRVYAAAGALASELGREPSHGEIADRLGLSAEAVEQSLAARARRWEDVDRVGRADALPSLFPHELQRALAQIGARHRTIVVWRFFHDVTEREIGRRLGVTESRASQLIRDAIGQLRRQFDVVDGVKKARAPSHPPRRRARPTVKTLDVGPSMVTTEKPYKVLCISMYKRDIERVDAMVRALKERGLTNASRSVLIRYALARVELDSVPHSLECDNEGPGPSR